METAAPQISLHPGVLCSLDSLYLRRLRSRSLHLEAALKKLCNDFAARALPLQGFGGAHSKCRSLAAQLPSCRECGRRSPLRGDASGGEAVQFADGSGGLPPLEEIQVFNPRVACKNSKPKHPYRTIWNRKLSLPDVVASRWAAPPGLSTSRGAAFLKHAEPWQLRSVANHCTWTLCPQNSAATSLLNYLSTNIHTCWG